VQFKNWDIETMCVLCYAMLFVFVFVQGEWSSADNKEREIPHYLSALPDDSALDTSFPLSLLSLVLSCLVLSCLGEMMMDALYTIGSVTQVRYWGRTLYTLPYLAMRCHAKPYLAMLCYAILCFVAIIF
jgi:Ca2+/Na+ antiporter